MDADILAGAGAIKGIIYGGGSRGRSGPHYCLNRAIEQGKIVAEEYSSLSMAFRFLAGSLGLPFIPIRSLQGSDTLKRVQEISPDTSSMLKDPFTGDEWLVLKPLHPDVAVVQVQISDTEGYAWLLGPRWENIEQVKASTRTIVITEKLVSTEKIRQEPDRTLIPGFRVSHVVQLPFSAHPSSVYQVYDFDEEHIEILARLTKTEEGTQEYLDKYVFGVKDHWEYLEKVGGMQHLNKLIADPILGY
jgi:acyl CoA:acetate/3-ketoacid CoA transferase alpha subunit